MKKDRCNKYASDLAEFLKINTVSSYGEVDYSKFFGFHKLMKKTFPHLFSKASLEKFGASLLFKWKGESEREPILFLNHHDVVEAGGKWRYNPFGGEIVDGKLFGRGALDTKSGLYCMLQAAEELIEKGFTPKNDIYFMSTCDEECDSKGAGTIAKTLKDRGIKFKFTLDEGGMIMHDPIGIADGDFAMVGVGEKGCLSLKFTANSLGGHASAPTKNSPLVRLGKFMAEIDDSDIFKAQVSPVVIEMFKRFSIKMTGAKKQLFRNAELVKPAIKGIMPKFSATANAMLKTTLAFTMASGSESFNSIPQEAFVIGNMRTSHHQGVEDSVRAVTELAKKYDIKVEVVDEAVESPVADIKGEYFSLIESAVHSVYSEVITVPYITNTASDSRFLGIVCDNSYRFTPFFIDEQQLDSIHGLNENINVDCLDKAVDFYKFIMENN